MDFWELIIATQMVANGPLSATVRFPPWLKHPVMPLIAVCRVRTIRINSAFCL